VKAFVMKATRAPFTAQEVRTLQPGPGQSHPSASIRCLCTDVHVWNGELPVPLPMFWA